MITIIIKYLIMHDEHNTLLLIMQDKYIDSAVVWRWFEWLSSLRKETRTLEYGMTVFDKKNKRMGILMQQKREAMGSTFNIGMW